MSQDDLSKWEQYKQNLGETRPWDLLNPNIARTPEELAEDRYNMCLECPEFIQLTKQCKKCGCFMQLKTKIEQAVCPLGKW